GGPASTSLCGSRGSCQSNDAFQQHLDMFRAGPSIHRYLLRTSYLARGYGNCQCRLSVLHFVVLCCVVLCRAVSGGGGGLSPVYVRCGNFVLGLRPSLGAPTEHFNIPCWNIHPQTSVFLAGGRMIRSVFL
ncbi:unnamed protein product, partial [Pylaiella littoralis]